MHLCVHEPRFGVVCQLVKAPAIWQIRHYFIPENLSGLKLIDFSCTATLHFNENIDGQYVDLYPQYKNRKSSQMLHTGPLTLADSCVLSPRRDSHPPPICESSLSIIAPVLLLPPLAPLPPPLASPRWETIFTAISARCPAVARECTNADRPPSASSQALELVSWRDWPFSPTVTSYKTFDSRLRRRRRHPLQDGAWRTAAGAKCNELFLPGPWIPLLFLFSLACCLLLHPSLWRAVHTSSCGVLFAMLS